MKSSGSAPRSSAAWPAAVNTFEYGRSAEGRPIEALIASESGALTAQELRERRIPVLMIQAGIHPGESDGKDGGFIAHARIIVARRGSGRTRAHRRAVRAGIQYRRP